MGLAVELGLDLGLGLGLGRRYFRVDELPNEGLRQTVDMIVQGRVVVLAAACLFGDRQESGDSFGAPPDLICHDVEAQSVFRHFPVICLAPTKRSEVARVGSAAALGVDRVGLELCDDFSSARGAPRLAAIREALRGLQGPPRVAGEAPDVAGSPLVVERVAEHFGGSVQIPEESGPCDAVKISSEVVWRACNLRTTHVFISSS